LVDLEREASRDINAVKERLAFEATTLAHGIDAATRAQEGARAAFGGGGDSGHMPSLEVALPELVVDLLVSSALCSSKSDARRQIKGGAVRVGETRITDIQALLLPETCDESGAVVLWRGKKRSVRLVHSA
jgi:tyrosyl-tRNA synthetase